MATLMAAVFILSLGLALILILINSTICKKAIQEREKPSPFECGFDPKSPRRLPFSLRFFLIAVIFLIFDVEITLILPVPVIMFLSHPALLRRIISFFIAILILGLYHEWNQGALEWK